MSGKARYVTGESGRLPADLLAAAAEDARGRIAGLRRDLDLIIAAADTATDDEHDPEGTTAFDRARTQSLLDGATATLAEIQAALARVESDDYGTCEACGEPIGAARLEARPAARTCIACASRR